MLVAWRARGGTSPPSRTLVDPELHHGQISMTQKDGTPPVPRRNAHNGTWYIAWPPLLAAQSSSVLLLAVLGLVRSLVENRYKAGTKPATCSTCGKNFPRPNISGIESRIASPARSQKSSVLSWSEALCEQSRGQVETVWPAAMGPCAPREPVPFSSDFVATSEHAVISGLSAGSIAPVQGIFRVVCTVTHGFGGVEPVPRATCISTPIKPVFFSSGLTVTSEHAVISGFSAESSALVHGTSRVDRAVSHGFDGTVSGLVGPVEKTRLLHTSQGLNPMWARSMHMLVILELNWCLGPRTFAERNVTLRRSSAIPKRSKKAQRDAKRKFVAQPEISHEAAELNFWESGSPHRRKNSWYHTRQPLTRLAAWARYTVWCRKRWWSSEATEVSVRRLWRISPESETQA